MQTRRKIRDAVEPLPSIVEALCLIKKEKEEAEEEQEQKQKKKMEEIEWATLQCEIFSTPPPLPRSSTQL